VSVSERSTGSGTFPAQPGGRLWNNGNDVCVNSSRSVNFSLTLSLTFARSLRERPALAARREPLRGWWFLLFVAHLRRLLGESDVQTVVVRSVVERRAKWSGVERGDSHRSRNAADGGDTLTETPDILTQQPDILTYFPDILTPLIPGELAGKTRIDTSLAFPD